ncbi:MAG TPA: DUF4352 domain-containing protein [Candidatus Olsenella avistercoris]|nr:DUF4352 domain-containing protein [Candidatus Olsenella avistercoris]
MSDKNMGKSTSGTAIAGLVLGIVAAVSSWVPIVNNLSFLIGLVGLVLAVVGLVGVMRGKKSGKGLAIAALVVNVAAIVIVLGTQSAMSAAIDEATNGPAVSGVTAQSSDDSADDSADASTGDPAQPASTDLAPGTSVDLANGLSVTVDSVEAGLVNYDGSTVVGVHVTYVNNGEEGASYNSYDWKGENADGAQEHTVYFSEATDDLGYGTLAAGGTKSGTIYFAEGTVKALYFGSPLSDTPTSSWVVE